MSEAGNLRALLSCAFYRFSGLNLSPEETPEMSFEADARSLRQAITSFGNISTQVGLCFDFHTLADKRIYLLSDS